MLNCKDIYYIDDILDGYYVYDKNGIFIKSKITYINYFKDGFGDLDYIELVLQNGSVILHIDYPIKSIKRLPNANASAKFEWCFTIRNNKFEHMGYIAKPKSILNRNWDI